MSLLDTASLIVTPNGYKEGKLYSVIPSDGSGDMSVVRATTATRVNSAGLVELVPYNLVQYSEQFENAAWTKQNFGTTFTLTDNFTTAPNGTLTACKYTWTAMGSSQYFSVYQTNALPSNQYTFSVYMKGAVGGEKLYIYNYPTYTTQLCTLTTEWQRFSITVTTNQQYFYIGGEFGQGGMTTLPAGTAYLWGAQLNEGSTALPYQKTETRLNIPRLDYSNGTCPSLLVEPQRTNTFIWSEKLLVGYAFAYTSGTFTVTENTTDTLDPFGNNNADKFTTAASSVNHNDSYNNSNGSGNMTLSIFAKKGIGTAINLYEYNVLSGIGFATTFDIENGTIISTWGSLVSNSIEDYGNGWYRCSITGPDTSAAGNIHRVTTFEGQTYLFGWQLELNSNYPTSYIPTTSASVTRNADVISKTGISSLIGSSEYTLFWNGKHIVTGQYNSFATCYQASNNNNSVRFYRNNSNNAIRAALFNVSSGLSLDLNSGITTENAKCALRVKAGDYAFFVNGSLVASSASALAPSSSLDALNIQYFDASQSFQQELKGLAFWKTALTNTQLATLTTI